jgi:hypothetical protein
VLQLAINEMSKTKPALDFDRLREGARLLQGAHGRKTSALGNHLFLAVQGKLACVYHATLAHNPPHVPESARQMLRDLRDAEVDPGTSHHHDEERWD